MRAKHKLTELSIKQAIKKANSSTKTIKISDGGGMYLQIQPNGSKYWRMNCRINGKQITLSFGVWPDVSLAQARMMQEESQERVGRGINPIEEKREQSRLQLEEMLVKESKEDILKNTFKKVSHEWYKRQTLNWTEKHASDVINSLKYHVYPDLGEKPISSITKQDVIASLRKIEAEGMHETCYRVRQRLEAIFDYAEIEDHCIGNPSKGLQKIFIKPKPKSHHSLPISELPELLKKIESDKVTYPSTILAMKFMILTFVRSSELRFADWDEFDLKSKEPLWIIPGERMKMRETHNVPLSKQALEILIEMQKHSGAEGYVFPQVRNPKKPMSENTLLYFSNRLGYAGRNTIHGFRTIASTILNETSKWSPDVIELQLAHQEYNKVRRAYNRAEHLDERRKMMDWWSNYIDSLMKPADVIYINNKLRRKG
jgi:integrase